jgi:hypothetical protein
MTSSVKGKTCNGKIGVLAALSLQIQAFWDLTLGGG